MRLLYLQNKTDLALQLYMDDVREISDLYPIIYLFFIVIEFQKYFQ